VARAAQLDRTLDRQGVGNGGDLAPFALNAALPPGR
jgi:hypothetical protein